MATKHNMGVLDTPFHLRQGGGGVFKEQGHPQLPFVCTRSDLCPYTEKRKLEVADGSLGDHELRRLLRHHHIYMRMLFDDLNYMAELKTCADPAPGLTRRGLTIPLIVQPLLSRMAPWKQVSFAKMPILCVTPSEPTAVCKESTPRKCFYTSPPPPHPLLHFRTQTWRREHTS